MRRRRGIAHIAATIEHDAFAGCGGLRVVLGALRKCRRVRAWVAFAIAHLLVLHVLLASFAASPAFADHLSAADGLSVICYGSGDGHAVGDADHPPAAPAPQHQAACFLCTIAKGTAAAVLVGHCIGMLEAGLSSELEPHSDDPGVRAFAPAGQYQRGPPAAVVSAA